MTNVVFRVTGCEMGDHPYWSDGNDTCGLCGESVDCQACGQPAVEQGDFDGPLCEEHLDVAYESALAERYCDSMRGN